MAVSKQITPEDLVRGLECPVCQELFRNPKVLPCGHTLCLSPCLEQICHGKSKMNCPECRTEHAIPSKGIKDFATNITLTRLFELPKSPLDCTGCPLCGESEELVKCLHCGLMICEECKQTHTLNFRDQLLEMLGNLEAETNPDAIASICEQLKQIEYSVKKNSKAILEKISETTEQLRFIVDQKEKDLMKTAQDYEKEEKNTIKLTEQEICKSLQDVNLFCKSTIGELKQRGPFQGKLLKILNTYRAKQRLVSENKLKLNHVARDINIDTNLKAFKNVIGELGTISIRSLTRDPDEFVDDNDSASAMPSSETGATLPTKSILKRNLSSVILCIGSLGSQDEQLNEPFGIAVDHITKDIFVVDSENLRIQVFNSKGQPKTRFRNNFSVPIGIVVSGAGKVAVSDLDKNCIKIFTRNGNLTQTIGIKANDDCLQFDRPMGIALDNDGHIHVCDKGNNRIQVVSTNGQFIGMYSPWKNNCSGSPKYVSIAKNGDIAVILENTSVVILNNRKQLLNVFSPKNANLTGIYWLSDSKYVVVTDFRKHILEVYNVQGQLKRKIGTPGFFVGQLQGPRGVVIDDEGFLYVSNRLNHMVQKF